MRSLPSADDLMSLREFTPEEPLRLLVSACLAGELCGVDGSSNGDYPWIRKLLGAPNVQAFGFCPEKFSFGVPRDLPDIHGGDGFDVLDGKAKVLTQKGEDWTEGMIHAAYEMLACARANRIELAIMMDMSAACGSQVISDGCRLVEKRSFRQGPGVAAALLIRVGIKVISQRDFRTLELLKQKLDARHAIDTEARDHHETPWYREYFS